jgi:signal peptidase
MTRLLGPAVLVVLAAAWFVTLRPAPLGGPAAYVVVSGHSMQPAFAPGALVVARRQDSYEVGDVIVYRVPRGASGAGTRVIHRVVGGSRAGGYITRGDNRKWPDRWRPRPRDVEGAKLVAVPGVGRAMMLLGTPLAIGGLLAVLAFLGAGDQTLPRRLRRTRHGAAPAVAAAPPARAPVVARSGAVAVGVAWADPGVHERAWPAPEPEPAPPVVPMPAPCAPVAHPHGVRAARRGRPGVAAGAAVVAGAAMVALCTRGLRRR